MGLFFRGIGAFLLLLPMWLAFGQLGTNFQSFTVDDGLAQNTVWDMIEDHRGYIWIATADGLNRFDGYNFKHYKHNPADSTTIAGITIHSLFIDSQQTLWASHDRGISRYDRIRDRFVNVSGFDQSTVLNEAGGFLWVLTYQGEVHKIDYQGITIRRFRPDNAGRHKGSMRKALALGNRIFGTATFGFFEIDAATDQVRVLNNKTGYIGALQLLNDSTVFSPGRVSFLYHIRSGRFEEVDLKTPLNYNAGSTGLVWYRGDLLMSSYFGLHVLDPVTLKVKRHIRSFERGKSEAFHYIQSLYVDRNDNLYIGTNGDGLKIHQPSKNNIALYSTGEVSTDFVKSISTVGDQLVVGLFSVGMVIFDDYSTYRHVQFDIGRSPSSVLAVQRYDANRLILVNHNSLVLYNVNTHREERRVTLEPSSAAIQGIHHPVLQRWQHRWLVNNETDIYEVDENFRLTHFYTSPTMYISTFFRQSEVLWVGTESNLTRKDLSSGEVQVLLKDYFIKSLLWSVDNQLWVATTAGLFVLDGDGNQLDNHNISTGLPNDFVYGVLEDDLGYVWISHNKGLTRIDPRTNSYRHFGLGDGLQSNEFNTGAFYKDEQGYLYFGGVGGVNKIDPKKLDVPLTYPKIAINQINLLDEPLASDTSYNELKVLRLAHNENILSFDFSALDFRARENIRYSYILEGYDNEWIESGDRHFARYANLPSGTFTFRVRATFEGQPWSDYTRDVQIIIATPFWQTWWFMAISGLLIVALFGLAVRVFIKRQGTKLRRELEVQHQLELERIRISRDLHDNVGAQLSYLITNMEWMAENPDDFDLNKKREQLKLLSEAGRQAISTLRQTIWAISQQELSVEEFADRYKQFALKMVEFGQDVQITFDEKITHAHMLSPAVALNLFRIAQEAFNNALKHAQARHIRVHFRSTPEHVFYFELTDDGVGFDPQLAMQNGHYGLKNMHARSAECQAAIELRASFGQGTTVTLSWPQK